MAVSRARKVVVVDEKDNFKVSNLMNVTLSCITELLMVLLPLNGWLNSNNILNNQPYYWLEKVNGNPYKKN